MGGLVMERKIIRTQIVQGISSRIIQESGNEETLQDLELKLGIDGLLQRVFGEKTIFYQDLLEEYNKFSKGTESSLFAWMYVLNANFGIVIDEHIYLYHYNPDISNQQKKIFPWEYMDGEKYLGDVWWFSDDVILEDVKELSVLDFLEKYKGY